MLKSVGLILLFSLGISFSSFGAVPESPIAIIDHGPRASHKIALTFDACPTQHADQYDEGVVNVLLEQKVPATIFMSGRWVEKNPDHARFLASQPQFEIAAHSYYHPHMTEKDDTRDRREFIRTQTVIRKITGKTAHYFRPPFGEVDERVAKLAAESGLVTIQYDLASGDPDPKLSAERIARYVVRDAKGGSIIVFHLNRNGVHTAEALPKIIAGLRSRGFEFVTVGELLKNGGAAPVRREAGKGVPIAEHALGLVPSH